MGLIQGGFKSNVVPDRCSVTSDRRILPTETYVEAVADIKGVISMLAAKDLDLHAELTLFRPGVPVNTPPDAPIVQTCQTVAGDLSIDPAPVGYEQSSDGRQFAELGLPVVFFGPAVPSEAHKADEHIALDEVVETATFCVLLAARGLPKVRPSSGDDTE